MSVDILACWLKETWASKYKQVPNGTVKKFKACLCASCVDQQLEGINFLETYAPVSQ